MMATASAKRVAVAIFSSKANCKMETFNVPGGIEPVKLKKNPRKNTYK